MGDIIGIGPKLRECDRRGCGWVAERESLGICPVAQMSAPLYILSLKRTRINQEEAQNKRRDTEKLKGKDSKEVDTSPGVWVAHLLLHLVSLR